VGGTGRASRRVAPDRRSMLASRSTALYARGRRRVHRPSPGPGGRRISTGSFDGALPADFGVQHVERPAGTPRRPGPAVARGRPAGSGSAVRSCRRCGCGCGRARRVYLPTVRAFAACRLAAAVRWVCGIIAPIRPTGQRAAHCRGRRRPPLPSRSGSLDLRSCSPTRATLPVTGVSSASVRDDHDRSQRGAALSGGGSRECCLRVRLSRRWRARPLAQGVGFAG
jgi:hypothetical protein